MGKADYISNGYGYRTDEHGRVIQAYGELRLTDKSRAMHEGMLRYLDEQEEVLLHGLSGAERETLLRLLGVMLSNMQDE